jgi:hypothetical protein
MSNSESLTSHAARWSATHATRVVRGWLALMPVVACSRRWLTRQPPLLLGGSCARVVGVVAGVGASAQARSRHRARGGVHRLRVLCGLAPLACGVLLMLAALPPEALASTNWATGVEAPLPANAGTIPQVSLGSVSCASAGNCTAVGGYRDSSGNFQALLLGETSGTWATGIEASLPANAGADPQVSLGSVSCASAGNCTDVGGYTDTSGHYQGLLLSETSGRWATGVEASLPANAGTNPEVGLVSLSCASARECTAVGLYHNSSGRDEGLLLSERSGKWATGVEPSLPAHAGTNPNAEVESVSCASAGNCTAVGFYDFNTASSRGLLLTETSGKWATGVEASQPANAGTTHHAYVVSVSCASAGNCTADGEYTDRSGHYEGLLFSETSGSALALIGSAASNGAGVTDKLICGPSALGPCRVTEALSTTETTQGGRPVGVSASTRRKSRTVIVATKTVMIRPGRTVTVTVKLNATGRKLLARFGKLPVTLAITLRQNGRHLAIANTKLTVKPRKK